MKSHGAEGPGLARPRAPVRAALRRAALPAALTTCLAAMAQAPAPKPPGCAGAEHRQFDFWAGRWAVFTPDGKPAGENRIEPIEGGCALQESWRGAGGFSGTSLNHWDAAARVWRQHWVDNRGGTLQLAGGLEGSSMVLTGSAPQAGKPDALLQHRITWTPLADGAVRQWWQRSLDGGKTWATAFDGRYVRQP
jgi:hypothetical protein